MKEKELIDLYKLYFDNLDENNNYILIEDFVKIVKSKKDEIFILDIRRTEDFEKNNINGSVNIPFKIIMKEENLKRLPKDKLIIIVCYVGHTASQTMVMLTTLGYKVKTLRFGTGVLSDGTKISEKALFDFFK